MTYRVEINQCLEQFHRAHEALIERLGGAHYLARTNGWGHSHWQIMKQGWQRQYNATPDGENNNWKYLDFASEKHYTVFILKWS